jgi:hypothetical protein
VHILGGQIQTGQEGSHRSYVVSFAVFGRDESFVTPPEMNPVPWDIAGERMLTHGFQAGGSHPPTSEDDVGNTSGGQCPHCRVRELIGDTLSQFISRRKPLDDVDHYDFLADDEDVRRDDVADVVATLVLVVDSADAA